MIKKGEQNQRPDGPKPDIRPGVQNSVCRDTTEARLDSDGMRRTVYGNAALAVSDAKQILNQTFDYTRPSNNMKEAAKGSALIVIRRLVEGFCLSEEEVMQQVKFAFRG